MHAEDDDQSAPTQPKTAIPDLATPTSLPALPAEVLRLVARKIITRKDLASCTLVSKAFFTIFGGELWRQVRLKDIGHVRGTPNSRTRLTMLSFVEVLDLEDHGAADCAIWCYDIAKHCRRLKTIIVPYRGPICTNNGPCRAIPTNKQLKLVFRNTDSPLIDAPADVATKKELQDWAEKRTPIGRVQHVQRAVIEFGNDSGVRRGRLPRISCGPVGTPITAQLPLRELTLVFTPLTPYGVYRDHALGQTDHHNLWINTAPPIAHSMEEIPDDRHDLCSNLALTCLSVPDDCVITIANIDQIPVWSGQQADDKVVGIRFMSGRLYSVYGLYRNLEDGTLVLEAQLQSDRLEAEEEIDARVELIKDTMKLWMRELLKAGGQEDTLEARWANITFVTLKEYMDTPGTEDEWYNHPWQDDWL